MLNWAPEINCILFADDTDVFRTDHQLSKTKLSNKADGVANKLGNICDKTIQFKFKAANKSLNLQNYTSIVRQSLLVQKSETVIFAYQFRNISFKGGQLILEKT